MLTERPSSIMWRFRLVASCMVLTAIALVQQPGRIVGDTKTDLVLNPGGFLARALYLWDPAGSFGQVQNQAYGYLFPMGPFFWVSRLLGTPPWVTQRLWWALIFVVAFLGVVKLCSVLGIGTPAMRIVGGFAFALSPRVLTVIGPSSIEVWPSALAPWVLIPLIIGLHRGNPRHMAALSAIAVTCVGGVNAAATFAVIPLGVVWLILAAPGLRRRELMIFWPVFVALGTLWWLIPLFLLGSVSPPFLDFIESSSTTTFASTAFDALRGTTNWLPYLDSQSVSGNALLRNSTYIINSAVVIALGLMGIVRKDNPVRKFLMMSLVLGLALVTLGHAGAGAGTSVIQGLLDGALAPLRNTHKFDPILRVSLVLGLVHLASVAGSHKKAGSKSRFTSRSGVFVLTCAAVLGSTVPAWTAQLPNRGAYAGAPGYWKDAATWLNGHAQKQNSLLLPGSAFADYVWGSPRDELLQSLGDTPWSVRNAVPLSPAGNIRTLDALEGAFARGKGSSALTGFLRRSGIRYLVVRNDLVNDGRVTDPEFVYSTISSLPGVRSVKSFGPKVGSPATQETDDGDTVFIDHGLQSRHPAVEVFEVSGVDSAKVYAQDLAKTPVIAGSPDALIQLGGSIAPHTAAVLAGDYLAGAAPENVVLTDTNRRQEAAFGRVIANRSASLAVSDRYRIDRPVHDYERAGAQRWKTIPKLEGALRISDSSSQSDVTATTIDPARQPWSAFDTDPATRWTADSNASGTKAWIEIVFARPVSVIGLAIHLSNDQPIREVTVVTDAGTRKSSVEPGVDFSLNVVAGLTKKLRISAPTSGLEPLSVDDITVPGIRLSRPLRLPSLPASWGTPNEILLTAEPGAATCLDVGAISRCLPGKTGLGEDGKVLDRLFTLQAPRSYGAALRVVPTASQELNDYFTGDVRLTASSTASGDPVAGVLATIDANPHTGWISTLRDVTPDLTVTFDHERRLSEMTLVTDPTLAASAPKEAKLLFDTGVKRSVRFDISGRASFATVKASSVKIHITDAYVRSNLAFDGSGSGLPIGISEIGFPGSGLTVASGADQSRDLPCGSGPTLDLDGQKITTSISASLRDILSREPVVAAICGSRALAIDAGDHRITARSNKAFRVTAVQLGDADARVAAGASVDVIERSHNSLTTAVLSGSGPQVVSLSQNANRGWRAESGSKSLVVNGWMQGWVIDSDSRLEARFVLSGPYRAGLVVGLLGVLALLAFAWTSRSGQAPAPYVGHSRRGALRGVAAMVLAIGSMILVAGGWGLLVFLLSGAFTLAWSRKWSADWLAAVWIVAAASAYFVRPWGNAQGWAGSLFWPQLAVVASFGAAAVLVFEEPTRAFLKRINGISTRR